MHSVHGAGNHLIIPTYAHKLYKTVSYPYTCSMPLEGKEEYFGESERK
jgi:hypothetical protein